MAHRPCLILLLAACGYAADLRPLPNFSAGESSLQITSRCVPRMPFTVAGEHGAILGRQDGTFEAWLWPVKILSDFKMSAQLANYGVPIDVNALAAGIRVTPAETVITYSHAAFTIRQHMFAARGSGVPAADAVVYFEIESIRPLDLTLSFTPEMLRMWPAPNFGRPNGEWKADGDSGAYLLHTDNAKFSAVVAMPHTRPGILPPYQEHPQTYPLQFLLSFDPKRDHGSVFPLIFALASGDDPNGQAAGIEATIPQLYSQTQEYYAHFFDTRLIAETPDKHLDEALKWAEVSIDQLQVQHGSETGLVAGYYESADSARPGFGWFFGRDTLWSSYAINSYGDFALTRRALDFLIQRQRADGKIMHEFSQMAETVDWKSTPYFFASADATPLLVMAMWDYVKTSGDSAYLKQNWEAIRKAYAFTRAHDTDGIYDNSEGTGWVESWPPGMPHQEIYLAALDQQSADAMSHLAGLMKDAALSADAKKAAMEIRAKIESEYFDPASQFYAFSRNRDGSRDDTASIYPSVAWWDGTLSLQKAGPMLARWASSEFSTDWGTRDISDRTPFYDPISYHQGSVWPLFTGWVSLAEYRAGRSLSAYAHLMQNANLTWTQDLGAVTELLSGEFFQPLGRSTSHQLWSSAMVLTPLLRGLFGLDWDAPNRTLRIVPHLPATWDHARLRHVFLGSSIIDLEYRRNAGQLTVSSRTEAAETLCLRTGSAPETSCTAAPSTLHTISIPLDPVELELAENLPPEGSVTSHVKVIDQNVSDRAATFTLEGEAGSQYDIPIRLNRPRISVEGGRIDAKSGQIHVRFRETAGRNRVTLKFTW